MSAVRATPWRVEGAPPPYDPGIYAGEGRNKTRLAGCYGPREHADANAAYIVKCVNAHDELVEALGALLEITATHVDYFGSSWYVVRDDERASAYSGKANDTEAGAVAERVDWLLHAQAHARAILAKVSA